MNKKIIKCLSEVLSKDISVIEKLDPNVPLSDIDFTSIALVHFVVRIEEELKIEILDSDLLYENFSLRATTADAGSTATDGDFPYGS